MKYDEIKELLDNLINEVSNDPREQQYTFVKNIAADFLEKIKKFENISEKFNADNLSNLFPLLMERFDGIKEQIKQNIENTKDKDSINEANIQMVLKLIAEKYKGVNDDVYHALVGTSKFLALFDSNEALEKIIKNKDEMINDFDIIKFGKKCSEK